MKRTPGHSAGLPRPALSAARLEPPLLQPPLRRQRDPDVAYVLARGPGSTRRQRACCPGRIGLDRLAAPLLHKLPRLPPSGVLGDQVPCRRHISGSLWGGGGCTPASPWKPGRSRTITCIAADHPRERPRPGGPGPVCLLSFCIPKARADLEEAGRPRSHGGQAAFRPARHSQAAV